MAPSSGTRPISNIRGSSTEDGGDVSSGSTGGESSPTESSSSESSGSESSDDESRTSGERRRSYHSESRSVERTPVEDSKSRIMRCMPSPRRDSRFVPTLSNAAIIRNIVEGYERRVEKNVEALERQFLSRPPLPDSVRLELLGQVNRVVDATNELDRRKRVEGFFLRAAAAAADTQALGTQGSKKEISQIPPAKASPIDNGRAGRDDKLTVPTITGQQRQHRSTVAPHGEAYLKAPDLNGRSRLEGGAVTQEELTDPKSLRPLGEVGGASAERGAQSDKGESSRPPPPASAASAHRLLLRETEEGGRSRSDADAEDIRFHRHHNEERGNFARGEETLRASDFIDGFRLMLQPALDDPLERYIRIRSPDSAVLRLIDYYQKYADLHEIWDWERDPLLGFRSDVIYPQTQTLDVEELLRDAISLHEQLLRINAGNVRALSRVQDQLAEAWTEAEPVLKEAERLFVKSVTTVADAIDTQKRTDHWNLTVLANRVLGKQEKYMVYDPGQGRLKLSRDAYLEGIHTEELSSEKLTRKLYRRIAALFLEAGRRNGTRKPRRSGASRKRRDIEKTGGAGLSTAAAVGISDHDIPTAPSVKNVAPTPSFPSSAGIGALPAAKGEFPGAGVHFPADPKPEVLPLPPRRQGLLPAVYAAAASPSSKVNPPTPTGPLTEEALLPTVGVILPKPGQRADAAGPQKSITPSSAKQQIPSPKAQLQGEATQTIVSSKPVPKVAKLPQPGIAPIKLLKVAPKAVAAPAAAKLKLLPPRTPPPAVTTAGSHVASPTSKPAVRGPDAIVRTAVAAPLGAVTSPLSGKTAANKQDHDAAVESFAKGTLLGTPSLRSDGGIPKKVAATPRQR